MGWHNPDISWRELEARLSGRWRDRSTVPDGGDGPAFSRKRGAYTPPEPDLPTAPTVEAVPYAELHCHSNYSFLDGASHPEALVREGMRLGLSALALTDHDGFSGAARFAEAAQLHGLRTVYGAELSLGLTGPQNGVADPEGDHLLVLARGVEGYHALASAITEANLAGDQKGRPAYDVTELAERGRDRWVVLTGCRKGWARREGIAGLRRLVDLFGAQNVVVELTDHGGPGDGPANDALAGWAADLGLPCVATGNVHAARPAEARLAQAFAPDAVWPNWTAGWRLRPSCAPVPRWPTGSPAGPAPWRARSRSPTTAPSICARPRPNCRNSTSRPATRP